jgi:hypothetical protein
VKVPITAHKVSRKVKSHLKARAHAKAAKKSAKKSTHQVHADNLYEIAHPQDAKRQKAFRRTLTHVVLPIGLIVATASFAIGAEVISNNTKSTKAAPPVPANSVCRVFDLSAGGLAAKDSRIGMILNHPQYPTEIKINTSGYVRNYVYAVDGNAYTYGAESVINNVLKTPGNSYVYVKICIVNPGPAMPPFMSRNALVDQQYRDFFGRKATAAELSYWASTGYNANQIVNWFVDQDKTQRGPLVRLYKAYYKRWPDAGGYDYWIRKMKTGTSLTKVSDFFATSNEFKTKYGSVSNEEFVLLVYNNVLNRTPDPGGYNYWVKRLNEKKITRGGVMLQFSESSEFKRKYGLDCELTGVTLRMLRRPATEAELAQWNPDVDPYALAYPIIFETSEYARRIVK